MSIIINGIDMPKGNSTKNLLIYSDGRVFTGHKDDTNYSAEELRTGKWTKENACEFCGFQPWFERDIHTLSFCPNCGAQVSDGMKFCNKCGTKLV